MKLCLLSRMCRLASGLVAVSVAIAWPVPAGAQAPEVLGPGSPGSPTPAIPAPRVFTRAVPARAVAARTAQAPAMPTAGGIPAPVVPSPAPPTVGTTPAPVIPTPAPAAPARPGLADLVGEVGPVANEPAAPPPANYEAAPPPKISYGPLEVIRESIFGAASKEDWKPINLMTFFTEGWDQPFANAPEGTNLAPKQPWIGAPAGVFGRFTSLNFFYTNRLNDVPGVFLTPNAPYMPVHMYTTGNQYTGYADIWLPLNSRVELVVGTVFISANKANPAAGYIGNWGDTGVQARFHLIEQRNFSLVGMIGERIPTGKSANGNDIDYLTPGAEFWWNFAPHWVLRGGTQQNIDLGRKTAASVYVNQLSIGRYLTGATDATFFKQLAVFCTATDESGLSGQTRYTTDIYIFPAIRTGLGKADSWAAQFGVQIPVSGPQAYDWQPQFSLVKLW